jgi:hypothetical protein
MTTQLVPLTINNPGFKGYNSQTSSSNLDIGWATVLENAVFDLNSRITARQGWIKMTTSGTPGNHAFRALHAYETASNTTLYSAANNKIYVGAAALTDKTGTITTPTASNWKFVNFNRQYVVGFQASHDPCVADASVNGAFQNLSSVAGYTAPSVGDLRGGVAIAAFGRVWASDSDGQTFHYSKLLDHTKWADADGGGRFQTQAYWPNGSDYITGMGVLEDKLVVFGRHNILIYDSPQSASAVSPLTAFLADTIEGVGCTARDSIVNIGNDILFMSETGIRSLRRTILTTKAPLEDVTAAIRDVLLIYTAGHGDEVKACYNQKEGIYLITFPQASYSTIYCLDVKNLGSSTTQGATYEGVRISQWTGFGRCSAVVYGRDEVMYGGFRDTNGDGVIGRYQGYLDNTSTYTFTYKSPWINLQGNQPGTFYKIPKSASVITIGGGAYNVNFNWAFDFEESDKTESASVSSATELVEWGSSTSEWGEDEWNSNNKILYTTRYNLSRFGEYIRVGISYVVNGYEIALQKIDLFLRKGRLSR